MDQFGQQEVKKLDELEDQLKCEASKLRRYWGWLTVSKHYASPLQRLDLCAGLEQQLDKLLAKKYPEVDRLVSTLRFEPPSSVPAHVFNMMGVLRTQPLMWPNTSAFESPRSSPPTLESQRDDKSSTFSTSGSVLSQLFGTNHNETSNSNNSLTGTSGSAENTGAAVLHATAKNVWATDPAGRQTQSLCHIPGEVSLTGGATLAAWCNADKSLSLDEVPPKVINTRNCDTIENIAPLVTHTNHLDSKDWISHFGVSNGVDDSVEPFPLSSATQNQTLLPMQQQQQIMATKVSQETAFEHQQRTVGYYAAFAANWECRAGARYKIVYLSS